MLRRLALHDPISRDAAHEAAASLSIASSGKLTLAALISSSIRILTRLLLVEAEALSSKSNAGYNLICHFLK